MKRAWIEVDQSEKCLDRVGLDQYETILDRGLPITDNSPAGRRPTGGRGPWTRSLPLILWEEKYRFRSDLIWILAKTVK